MSALSNFPLRENPSHRGSVEHDGARSATNTPGAWGFDSMPILQERPTLAQVLEALDGFDDNALSAIESRAGALRQELAYEPVDDVQIPLFGEVAA